MADLPASSARPTCPGCSRPVRSGVELATALAHLAAEVALCPPPDLQFQLRELRAEVAGAHLRCSVHSVIGASPAR